MPQVVSVSDTGLNRCQRYLWSLPFLIFVYFPDSIAALDLVG